MSPAAPTVRTVDLDYLGLPGAIAAFVVEAPDGPVLVETGPASTLEALRAGLRALGHEPDDVRDALVTHIHLDHAGAAGALARAHGTRIHVHAFGAPHLADPAKLLASARRIYGDQMDRLWGTTLPVPAELVRPLGDGDVVEVAGAAVRVLETPGHARHHHAFALDTDAGRACFTGDAAGIAIPGHAHVGLPMPPPEFDLDAWTASVDRLEAERFDVLHVTHFGRVNDPARHLAAVRERLAAHVAFVEARLEQGVDRAALVDEYAAWCRAAARGDGVTERELRPYLTDNVLAMSVAGIARAWTKRREAAAGAR